jgi:hypothetical protein
MAIFMNGTATWNSVAFNDVISWELRVTGERVTHSSDTDNWLTWQAVVKRDVTATVNTDDVNQVAGYHDDVGATAQTLDLVAKTADGGSDVTVSGSAMVTEAAPQVAHATPDNTGSVAFGYISSDGTTSPLTIS